MRQEMTVVQKALAAYDVFATLVMTGTGVLATASAAGRQGASTAVESMVSGSGLGCINLPAEAVFMMGTGFVMYAGRGLVGSVANVVDLMNRCGCFAEKSNALNANDLVSPLNHVQLSSDSLRPSADAANGMDV